jgi:hypothetical protein
VFGFIRKTVNDSKNIRSNKQCSYEHNCKQKTRKKSENKDTPQKYFSISFKFFMFERNVQCDLFKYFNKLILQ